MKKLNFLFKFGTILATICWVLLIFFPAYTTENKQYIIGVIGILSLLYVYSLKIVKNHDETIYPKGGFTKLEGVINLFKNPRGVLVGWIHFLAFDLMVGLYIKFEAAQMGIPHFLQIPCFILTLMYGPFGLLLFFAVKLIYGQLYL